MFAPRFHARITHVDVFLRAGPRYEDEAYQSLVDLRSRLNKIPEADDREDSVLLYVALSPWVEELEGR